MRRGTLLTQVLLVNLLLIAAAVIAASIASNPENSLRDNLSSWKPPTSAYCCCESSSGSRSWRTA